MLSRYGRVLAVIGLLSMLAACGASGGTSSTGATSAATSPAAAATSPAAAQTMAPAATAMPAATMAATAAGATAATSTSTGATAAAAETTAAGGAATASATMTAGATATGGSATATAPLPPAKPDTSAKADLKGSGSSFVAKIMQKWVQDYKKVVPGVTINYQSTGSGQGVTDYLGHITDFGATDAFLTDEELAKGPDTLHIPVVAGAVVATYNLQGITNLQLSPDTLAGIFLGTISKWNDPKIAADNSGVSLPDKNISVVYRADGSGTTSIFTTYLSSVSPEWKQKVGAGKTVKWPVGQGAPKNDGVAAGVKNTDGAIGYVELIYALGNKLPAPAIKNAAGNFVKPSLDSVTEAANGFIKNLPDDLRLNIVNPPEGANAYPISGFTWLLLHKTMQDQAKAKAVTDFIYWTLANGDDSAKSLGYSPLPAPVKEKAVQKLEQIMANGAPVFKRP